MNINWIPETEEQYNTTLKWAEEFEKESERCQKLIIEGKNNPDEWKTIAHNSARAMAELLRGQAQKYQSRQNRVHLIEFEQAIADWFQLQQVKNNESFRGWEPQHPGTPAMVYFLPHGDTLDHIQLGAFKNSSAIWSLNIYLQPDGSYNLTAEKAVETDLLKSLEIWGDIVLGVYNP